MIRLNRKTISFPVSRCRLLSAELVFRCIRFVVHAKLESFANMRHYGSRVHHCLFDGLFVAAKLEMGNAQNAYAQFDTGTEKQLTKGIDDDLLAAQREHEV